MNVLLIDVDSKIPNLALMKLASYHKSLGDNVGFNVSDPDKIYASIVFNKNKHLADGLKLFYPRAQIDLGGGGYDLTKELPEEVNKMSPDYSIYPECDRYYGFTTRGCIRNCPFCVVRKKEGYFHRIFDDPKEALDNIIGNAKFNKIEFLDNNILADKDWFYALTEECIRRNLKVDFNQGIDIRLMDEDVAKRFNELKAINVWKFAFDNMNYKDHVLKGIEILKASGMDIRHKCLFYVYCSGDDMFEDALERCNILREHNATPFVMVDPEGNITKRVKKLRRWSVRPWLFWATTFDEFVYA